MKKTLGCSLLSLPFICVFIISSIMNGLMVTLGIFSAVLLAVIIIGLGVHLILGE